MFIKQSVVVKEFEKEGFECHPLGYDDYYETDINYQQCLAALLVPSEDNVVLKDNEYSFIPFDKKLMKSRTENPWTRLFTTLSAAERLWRT